MHYELMEWALGAVSMLAALGYGLFFLDKPPSPLRAVVKTTMMGALIPLIALMPWEGFSQLRPVLQGAIIASALGDCALAFDRKWATPVGILSFLVAQLCYLFVFYNLRSDEPPLLPRFGMIVLLVLTAIAFLVVLWPKLGPLAFGVGAYSLAITGMAATAMLLPWIGWPAMLGAVLFFVSDTTLSFELFRLAPDAPARRITGAIVWWTYVAAQALIVFGIIRASHQIIS